MKTIRRKLVFISLLLAFALSWSFVSCRIEETASGADVTVEESSGTDTETDQDSDGSENGGSQNDGSENDDSDEDGDSVKEAEYTVSHYLQDLSLDTYTLYEKETLKGTVGEETSAASKEIEGFTAESFNQHEIEEEVTTTVEIYYTRNSYTISFASNSSGATGQMEGMTAVYGQTVTLTQCGFELTGYYFGGWATSSDANITYGDEDSYTLGSSDVTLYAVWIENGAHSIVYAGTDDATNPNPASFRETEDIELLDADRDGYIFLGWYADEEFSGQVTGWSAGEKTDSVTLYALWTTSCITVTVSDLSEISLSQETSGSAVTFTVSDKDSYSGFAWYVNGAVQAGETSSSYSLETSSLESDVYQVLVVAEKDGVTYSGYASVKID